MQPEDLRSASSCDWPRNDAESCGARVGSLELARKAKTKDNAETQRTQSVRRVDETDGRLLVIVGASQNVNFTEPKSEKSVRLV